MDFKNAFDAKMIKQYFQEVFGTAVLIMLATAGSKNEEYQGAWQWGIAFVVMTTFFNGENHFQSYYTIYKTLCTKAMCPVQGLMYLVCQFFGAFLAAKISDVIGHSVDEVGALSFDQWKSGLAEFLMVSIFLCFYLHAKGTEGNVGSMPNALFVLFTVAISFMFKPDGVWSFNRCWTSKAGIEGCGVALVWGLAACIFTNVKRWLMVGEKAFWDFSD